MSVITAPTSAGGGYMKWFGIGAIVIGVLAISAPLATGLSITVLVGLLVVAAGMIRMVWAFQVDSLGKGLLRFAIGALTLICGIILVANPMLASGVLAIVLALYFVIDGACEVAAALRVRPSPGWGWLLAGGIVSLIFGVMIWRQYPLSGAWAVGVLLGIKLLLVGVSMITIGSIMQQPHA